jgi:hypothetical protein
VSFTLKIHGVGILFLVLFIVGFLVPGFWGDLLVLAGAFGVAPTTTINFRH